MNTLLAVQSETFSRGLAIAITGMVIVFLALFLISAFLTALPWVLERLSRIWPEVDEHSAADGHRESLLADDAQVMAAIGFVLHTELQRQMAAERGRTGNRD